ncbi:hypothetical protein [Nocardia jiangsuensis]|uniref:Uncharacterized protein n=1 Tax=Nocardia jiangsuensis TaxID=1691563 RepID=A0ABV8DSY9_9NOCA
MDPVTFIAAAVAAGAQAGLGDAAKQVIVDAYTGLRGLITRRYGVVDAEVVALESEPEEPLRRQLLARQLTKTGAGDDPELRAAAEEVLQLIAEKAPQAAEAVGIKVSNSTIRGDVEVTDLTVTGGGVGFDGDGLDVGGSLKFKGGQVGPHADPPAAHG